VSLPLWAPGPSGGSAGTLPGSLQLHCGPQILSAQPFRCHLWPAGAVCPWGWPPWHQCHCLNSFNVTLDSLLASIHPQSSQHIWGQMHKTRFMDKIVCTNSRIGINFSRFLKLCMYVVLFYRPQSSWNFKSMSLISIPILCPWMGAVFLLFHIFANKKHSHHNYIGMTMKVIAQTCAIYQM